MNIPGPDDKNVKTFLRYLTASFSAQVSGLSQDAIFVPNGMSRPGVFIMESTFHDAIVTINKRHLATASYEKYSKNGSAT